MGDSHQGGLRHSDILGGGGEGGEGRERREREGEGREGSRGRKLYITY